MRGALPVKGTMAAPCLAGGACALLAPVCLQKMADRAMLPWQAIPRRDALGRELCRDLGETQALMAERLHPGRRGLWIIGAEHLRR